MNRRMWILAGTAAALVASGIGVAAAGEQPPPEEPDYFPAVQHQYGTFDDPQISHPVIGKASLTCAPGGDFLLSYTASTQEGSTPGPRPTHADGELMVRTTYSYTSSRNSDGRAWGDLPMRGDALATGDARPAKPGWLVFAGDVTIPGHAKTDPAPADRGNFGVRVFLEITRYQQFDDGVHAASSKDTITSLKYPDC